MIEEIRLLKETIEESNLNENKIIESYKIGKMTVLSLEEYLKNLENNHVKVMREGDAVLQALKKEKHEFHVKNHHLKKEMEDD